jgi:plasmid stability protein
LPVNLSVKSIPDALAERLRARAERNHRSLQRELLGLPEAATNERSLLTPPVPASAQALSIEDAAARARKLFPQGTQGSVAFIRAMRDGR